jgi:hypothetical protein
MPSPRIKVDKPVRFLKDKNKQFPIVDGTGIKQGVYDEIMADLAYKIDVGEPIPEDGGFYRETVGQDYLLQKYNWIHLHLADDVLLVVEQTSDRVIFICLTNHALLFDERPRGNTVKRWLGSKIEAEKQKPLPPRQAANQPANTSTAQPVINPQTTTPSPNRLSLKPNTPPLPPPKKPPPGPPKKEHFDMRHFISLVS